MLSILKKTAAKVFGYYKTREEVFTFSKDSAEKVEPKVQVETKLLRLSEVTAQQWKQLRHLQGRTGTLYIRWCIAILYIRWRYGSPDTYILLAYVQGKLAHVGWVVPAKKIKKRYSFVADGSYFIIASFTPVDFRGLRIYPSQLRRIVESDIESETYWGLVACHNIASLKGVRRAGGIKAGEFIHEKWLHGVISRGKYFPKS
jgi:hypothetical protein